ncbi:PTS system D-fructose-specific IIA component (F1P-forming) (Frc family) [Saccharopolyspora erythraea NRRL 2338]|uniref:Fructose-specific permease n=2 Tax=Saccharopolyspora erythraea TaxID=1836 RepID=A4FC04_SACEN|nr:fructose PTS transporter subunit IIA [Saccharopolyspora erythraea]PFG95351.1 PTS system D-fructose-specific IIA component (F1P-forming) (Frc family) [Saccharopolyspora erythraea NRRL 2338]QRK91993.1 PTS sugar transporter subunit IIA [Saccharopolyspora erythraea]CAM01579.1 putative fructose-specific permease [Saccharopolyspora erythraea NRRL 2338]
MSTELITTELVDLDLADDDRRAAVRSLAERLVTAGRVTDLDRFLTDVEARESQMPTGLEGGIGIPHCRSAAVTTPTLAFGRSTGGIDFGAEDGPAKLIFLIAAPEGGGSDHMTVLAALARRLVRAEFKQTLLEATDPAQVAEYVREEVTP